jgi:hypothetical protein
MQSDASLSQSSDDGVSSVAEEQNFDQQSAQARHVGDMPSGDVSDGVSGRNPLDAIAKSMNRDEAAGKEKSTRELPPSDSSAKE